MALIQISEFGSVLLLLLLILVALRFRGCIDIDTGGCGWDGNELRTRTKGHANSECRGHGGSNDGEEHSNVNRRLLGVGLAHDVSYVLKLCV